MTPSELQVCHEPEKNKCRGIDVAEQYEALMNEKEAYLTKDQTNE